MSNIESYSPNFKFKIPDFNVATWHTEIKENFIAIDALIANFVRSQQYQGAWKKVTSYNISDLVFIDDPDSDYYGALFKVLIAHTTTGDDFDTFLGNNPTYYEVMGEMGAQIAARISQDWAQKIDGKVVINEVEIDYSAKAYAIGGTGTETNNAKYYKELADTYQQNAYQYKQDAASSEQNALLYMNTILQDQGFIAISADLLGDRTIYTCATNITAINTCSTNINDINTCAQNMQDINDAYENAVSASNSADSSAQSAALAYQYGNDKINQTHITHCVTHIPQDIKFELNNGILTLKAGSKVYKPDGFEQDGVTPKFTVITKTSDVIHDFAGNTGTYLLFDGPNPDYFATNKCVSGPTDSLSGQAWHVWYDTTNNLVKVYTEDGSTPIYNQSFPVAIVTISSGSVTFINHIFNGFGYFGSTVFTLPGIKGLAPNGRNEDGTLKNIEFTTSSVYICTLNSSHTDSATIYINSETFGCWYLNDDFVSEVLPSGTYNHVYKPISNEYWFCLEGGYYQTYDVPLCRVSFTNGVIDNFTQYSTFQALDYNYFNTVLNENFVKVSTLPAKPDPYKYYYIPES